MKKRLRIGRFIIIAVIIYFIYTVILQQQTLNNYEQQTATYQNQIEEANKKTDDLKDIKNNINSTEYIENMARERLGMYLPNERVYIDSTN